MSERILVVDASLESRGMLKSLFTIIGRPDIQWHTKTLGLFSQKVFYDVDIAFVNVEQENGVSGTEIIRYMRAERMVPLWCRFVLVSNNPGYKLECSFNTLTPVTVLHAPISSKILRELVNAHLKEMRLFGNIWQNIEKAAPKQLVVLMNKLKYSILSEEYQENMDKLKIRLFMKNRAPKLAAAVMEQIKTPETQLEEKYIINFQMGNEAGLSEAHKSAKSLETFRSTYIHTELYKELQYKNYDRALTVYNQKNKQEAECSDIVLGASLVTVEKGIDASNDLLSVWKSRTNNKQVLFYLVEKARLHSLLAAAIMGKNSGTEPKALIKELDEAIQNKLMDQDILKLKSYKPFIQILKLVYGQGKSALTYFDLLIRYLGGLDSFQLLIMFYASTKLGKEEESFKIHQALERKLLYMDLSSYSLTIYLLMQLIIENHMQKPDIVERFSKLADEHIDNGHCCRALTLKCFAFAHCNTDIDYNMKLLRLMQDTAVGKHWSVSKDMVAAKIKRQQLTMATAC